MTFMLIDDGNENTKKCRRFERWPDCLHCRLTLSWLTGWDSSCLGDQVPVWSEPGLPHPPVGGCGPHSPLSAVPFLLEVTHWRHGDACSNVYRKACSRTPSLRVVLQRRTWKRTRCWWILADCHKSPLLLPLRQHPGDSRRSENAMHPRCLAGQRRPADGAIYGWGLQRASRALPLPVAFQAASFLAF